MDFEMRALPLSDRFLVFLVSADFKLNYHGGFVAIGIFGNRFNRATLRVCFGEVVSEVPLQVPAPLCACTDRCTAPCKFAEEKCSERSRLCGESAQ